MPTYLFAQLFVLVIAVVAFFVVRMRQITFPNRVIPGAVLLILGPVVFMVVKALNPDSTIRIENMWLGFAIFYLSWIAFGFASCLGAGLIIEGVTKKRVGFTSLFPG